MSELRISKVCIQCIKKNSQVREIYFVIKSKLNSIYVSSVKQMSSSQLWQDQNVKIKVNGLQFVDLEIWQYQPNLMVSGEQICIQKLVSESNYKLLLPDGFLVTIRGCLENFILKKNKSNPSNSKIKGDCKQNRQDCNQKNLQFSSSSNEYGLTSIKTCHKNSSKQQIQNQVSTQQKSMKGSIMNKNSNYLLNKQIQQKIQQICFRRPLSTSQIYLQNSFSNDKLVQTKQNKLSKLIQRSYYNSVVESISNSRKFV